MIFSDWSIIYALVTGAGCSLQVIMIMEIMLNMMIELRKGSSKITNTNVVVDAATKLGVVF